MGRKKIGSATESVQPENPVSQEEVTSPTTGRRRFIAPMQKTKTLTKEQKQDLMHVAVCTVLSSSGFYEHEGWDEDGWPHFQPKKELPPMGLIEQENFMKDHVLLYFDQNGF